MNLKALKEELNSVKDAKKALLNNAITEVRSLEDSENEELRQLNDRIEDLKSENELLKYLQSLHRFILALSAFNSAYLFLSSALNSSVE